MVSNSEDADCNPLNVPPLTLLMCVEESMLTLTWIAGSPPEELLGMVASLESGPRMHIFHAKFSPNCPEIQYKPS